MTTALHSAALGGADGIPNGPVRDPRSFLPTEQWDKQIGLLMRDHPFDSVMAERVLGQAVAYLITAMESRGRGLGLTPGPIVDIGVHTMILDTALYRWFNDAHNGGRFLHHVPLVEMKNDGSVLRTAQEIARHGFLVDRPLWEADASRCGPCHPGNDSH